MSTAPTVAMILIAPNRGEPMQSMFSRSALRGLGLKADRYALQRGSWKGKGEEKHKPKRNVTLISADGIAAANRGRDVPFEPSDTRRNIVVRGLDVNKLIGKEFMIGAVRCRGVEYAEPCDRPDKLSGKKGFEQAFHGNGGVNCEILTDGEISVGDEITIL